MMKSRQGSVLMEFVIVLPLYMLLLSFAFVTGELSLHAIRLAGVADRTRALLSGDIEEFADVMALVSPNENLSYEGDGGGSARASSYKDSYGDDEEDDDVKWDGLPIVRASVSDFYTLTPLTRGFAAFWHRDTQDRLERNGDSGLHVGGVLDEMIKDSGVIGRVKGDDGLGMTGRERDPLDPRDGRDPSERVYGFVTLVRHEPKAMSGADFPIYETKEGLHGWTR